MILALAVSGLLLPALLGVLVGMLRLVDDPEAAVDHLNVFALYVAFPALLFVGLARAEEPLPGGWAFWVAVPLALLLALVPLRPVGDRVGGAAGTLALTVSFGNVAYLGLPVVEVVLGPQAMGTASLVVGLHVVLSLLVGPLLLLLWGGGDATGALGRSVRRVAVQPLLWAPLLGLASRLLPDGAREAAVALVAPLGRAAAPVALFLLGLYLHTHAARVRSVDRVVVAHVVAKLVWLPLVTACVLAILGLGRDEAAVILLLSSMPPAITTFALARAWRQGADRVAQAVVAGSGAAVVVVPLVAWWVRAG
ncbi:MAG: AEC family transporter [Alphaproteobacteria bacterium]|nr:AEC family transporter [Alphaproteobacteria bacterium]